MNWHKPHTSDGKQIFLPSIFPGCVVPIYHGRGDDITNGTKFSSSHKFAMYINSSGSHYQEFQFLEYVYMGGGAVFFNGANWGDELNFKIFAPATVGTSNPGAGGYDKVEIVSGSGLYTYIPNATITGDWDLNLTEKLNSNVDFTKVVPVPACDGDGFFDWDSDTNLVTLNLSQTGKYHLFDFDFDIVHYVSWLNMYGNGNESFINHSIKSRRILPHWKYRVDITRVGSGDLYITWRLFMGRKNPRP